jgi:hypothetical protein
MSIKDIAFFIKENNEVAYERIKNHVNKLGTDSPETFGESDASNLDLDAKRSIQKEALIVAINQYDQLENAVRQKLVLKNRIKLTLNIITAISSGGILALIGIDKNMLPWNLIAVLIAIISSVGSVFVDHLNISTETFFQKLGSASAERENAHAILLEVNLLSPITEENLNKIDKILISSIARLNTTRRELSMLDLKR